MFKARKWFRKLEVVGTPWKGLSRSSSGATGRMAGRPGPGKHLPGWNSIRRTSGEKEDVMLLTIMHLVIALTIHWY
jgi:hypothetical protein